MRIARPKEPVAAFKRKRAPPPQATKFLFWSTVTGLSFLVVLAVVFIPPGLQPRPSCATALTLRVDTAQGPWIRVTRAPVECVLGAFRAVLLRDNVVFDTLGAGLVGGTGSLAFADVDADGELGVDDYFIVNVPATGQNRLEILLVFDGRLQGEIEWSGAL